MIQGLSARWPGSFGPARLHPRASRLGASSRRRESRCEGRHTYMIGNDQDQGAAAERVGEVGERRVCDHDGDVGEKQGARKKKKNACGGGKKN